MDSAGEQYKPEATYRGTLVVGSDEFHTCRSECVTIPVIAGDAVSARFDVLEGIVFPEQNALPNTYYRAKQQNKPFEFFKQIYK